MQHALSFLYETNSCSTIKDTIQLLGIAPWHYYKYIGNVRKSPVEFRMHFLDTIFKYPFSGSIDVACKKELIDTYNSIGSDNRKKLAEYNLYENLADISQTLANRFKFYDVASHNHARKTIWLVASVYDYRISRSIESIGANATGLGTDILPSLVEHMNIETLKAVSQKFDMTPVRDTLIKYADPEHNVLIIMLTDIKVPVKTIKTYIKTKLTKNINYKTLNAINKKIVTLLLDRPKLFTRLQRRGYVHVTACYLDEFSSNESEDLFQMFYKVLDEKNRLVLYLKFANCLCRYGQVAKQKWTPIKINQKNLSTVKQYCSKAVKLFSIGLLNNNDVSTRTIKDMQSYDCCPEIVVNYLLGNSLESIMTQIKDLNKGSMNFRNTISETNLNKIPDLHVVYNQGDQIDINPTFRALIKGKKVYINRTLTRKELTVLVNEVGPCIRSLVSPAVFDKAKNMVPDISNVHSLYKGFLYYSATYNANSSITECSIDAQEYLSKTFPMALYDSDKLIDRHIYGPRIRSARTLILSLVNKRKNNVYTDLVISCKL